MKTVRLFSIAMAVVLLVVAVIPFAAVPAAAQAKIDSTSGSPTRAFMDAVRGLPLLAPMSISAPIISLSIQNANPASSVYSCSLIKQSPKDWATIKPRGSFDMVWTVQNTGAVWHANSTKFAYVGGSKMQTRGDSFTLDSDVARGKKIKLSVDMVAPKTLGTYTTLWALYSGSTRFCKVTLVLTVVTP